MNAGEILRRAAWTALDNMRGGRLQKLKEINKREILTGVTPEYRERRIEELLKYATEHCAFYRGLEKKDRLEDFPVQTKRDFLSHYEGIISDEYADRRDELARFTTSGSTGTPFTVLADRGKLDRVNMNFMSVMELNGFRLGMRRGEFRAWIKGKNTRTPMQLFITNLRMIDISNMSDDNIAAILERIKRERIQVLVAYSSAIEALVDYVGRKGRDVFPKNVEMIFTMGEALSANARERAAELFGIRPVLSYGNNENGFIAVSLPKEEGYVADLYNFHVEILAMDSDEPVPYGTLGRIVVTDYYNKAFPMIRYDTGDTGILMPEETGDGRIRERFTEIYGRQGSLIRNTKGEPLSIHVFMNNLLNFEGILSQARCIQEGEKEYLLQLNPEEGAKVDEAAVIASYRKYLGDDAVIKTEYISGIPIEQSGKTMVCVQKCEKYLS